MQGQEDANLVMPVTYTDTYGAEFVPAVSSAGLQVRFEWPPGKELSTRQFNQGQQLHVAIKATTLTGLGNPGVSIMFDISPEQGYSFAPIFRNGTTNFLGNVAFDVTLPIINAKAVCNVYAKYIVSGQSQITVPISIGNISPDPLPPPQSETDIITQIHEVAKWVVVGAGVIGLIYIASKAAPSVVSGVKAARRA